MMLSLGSYMPGGYGESSGSSSWLDILSPLPDEPSMPTPPPVPPIYTTGEQKGEVKIENGNWQAVLDYVTGAPPVQECDWKCWLNKNQLALLTVAGVVGVFLFVPGGKH